HRKARARGDAPQSRTGHCRRPDRGPDPRSRRVSRGGHPRQARRPLAGGRERHAAYPDVHGYRALHIVVWMWDTKVGHRPAEIQIRTKGENAWAQVVERLDAVLGSDLKHGEGPAEFREWLLAVSEWIGSPADRE